MVEIDPELCIGCQNCGAACPYDAISFDEASGTADKCNLCDHRAPGQDPLCVVTCPTRAIALVDADAVEQAVRHWRPGREVGLLNEDAGTRPTTRYLFRS
jgi:Fe-S-cluster-containing dehydrogenase component